MKLFFLALGLAVGAGHITYADEPAPVRTTLTAPQTTTLQPAPNSLPTPDGPGGSLNFPQLPMQPYGVATLSVCNNRVNPANAAEMATQMLLGTPVEVLGRERGYYQVRTPDGYVSWTDNAGISLMDADTFHQWQRAAKVVVTTDTCHSYHEPSEKAMRVSDLVQGDILQVLDKRKGFFKIAYPDGRVAYLLTKDAEDYKAWAARKNPNATQIIATAKTMMGVPYLWGGTSVKGVDCSGFTKTSFFLNGIVIPRDASQQAVVGEPVDILEGETASLPKCLKNLQPGDLLFFGSLRNRDGSNAATPRVNHTAIYLGNGEFIQAAGLVRINSLVPTAANYSDSGRRRLIGARRLLTAIGTPEITRVDAHPAYVAKD